MPQNGRELTLRLGMGGVCEIDRKKRDIAVRLIGSSSLWTMLHPPKTGAELSRPILRRPVETLVGQELPQG